MKRDTIRSIIIKNTFTFFNAVNIVLALLIMLTGQYRNLFFLGTVLTNWLINIVQQLRAKKMLDSLELLSQEKAEVVYGEEVSWFSPSELKQDMIVRLRAGSQASFDGTILSGQAEGDTAILTGESQPVELKAGNPLVSGTVILSGTLLAKVEKAGDDTYAANLEAQAKALKQKPGYLMAGIHKIVRWCTIFLIPACVLLGVFSYLKGESVNDALLASATAGIGMIPQGLVVLASVSMALAAIRLGRQNVLVHTLSAPETMAKTSILCLDKTGTITQGKMTLKEVRYFGNQAEAERILGSLFQQLDDANPTAQAIKTAFEDAHLPLEHLIPFDSDKKYCQGTLHERIWKCGAPDKLGIDKELYVSAMEEGSRVLALTQDGTCQALLIFSDPLRDGIQTVLSKLESQDVRICILSGDSLPTVQAIAKEAGLEGRGIDMSKHVSLDDLSSYSFFARVSPEQKEEIVTMFSKTGTVSMIGDGINDLLAMKAANASIAMGSGMAAARQAADIVLLDSDMNKLPDIIRQGRRSVHSVEKTSGLFLVKTMLSFGLCLLCIFWLKQYPFVPIQLTLVSSLGVGIPSLIFTLEPEEGKISGSYLKNVFSHAFPGAASALILVCLLSGQPNFSTLCTWMLAMNMELVLIKTARPLTPLRWAILILMPVLFCICALGFPAFFQLEPVSWKILFLFPILLVLQTALELEHLTKLRLVILVLSIALAVSLSGTVTWTAAVYRDQKLQEARHETLSQMVMEERQTMQTIEKVTADGREEDVLTALKEQAADDAYAKTIETAAELERIEEDQMDQIEALTHSDAVLQARSLLEHYDQIDDFLLEYYLADEDRYDFVMASLNPETEPVQTLDEDLSQVPLLLQWDARWGYLSYGDSTVYVAGCAPTSLSMVFSYLKQDPAITPIAIKTFSEENGYYVSGAGTAHSLLTAAAKQWDANVQTVSLDAQSVMDQLEQGRILVFNMVPGDFTRVGHFIVVSGMEGGKLIVRDPNSITRSDKLWDMDTVLSQTAAIWAYWQ